MDISLSKNSYHSSTILLYLISLFLLNHVYGHENNFQKFSDQGIISPSINDIVQDKKGVIWFGTDNGLFSYDATDIKTFKADLNNANTLLHNLVFDLEIDEKGQLWIATSGGVCRYDDSNNVFVPIYPKQRTIKKDVYTQTIKVGNENEIWFSTSHLIWKYNQKSELFDSIPVPGLPEKQGFPFIHTFTRSKDNHLFISIDRGFYEFSPITKKFQLLDTIPVQEKDMLTHIEEGKKGELWTVSRNGNLSRFVSNKSLDYIKENLFENHSFTGVYSNGDDLCFSLYKQGVARYVSSDSLTFLDRNYFSDPDHQNISCLFTDKQSILWVGHSDIGISNAYPFLNFKTIHKTDFEYKELTSNIANCLLYSQKGNLVIGTRSGLFYNKQSYLTDTEVLSVFENKHGEKWAGTSEKGIFVLNDKNKIILELTPSSGFKYRDIRKIIMDKQGIYWFVSHGKGICSYNRQTQTITNYSSIGNAKLAPSGDWTFDIICDSQNRIWIASNRGLSCLSSDRDSIQHFGHDKNKAGSIISNDLRALYEDSNENIWCGSLEGVSIYNPLKNEFKHVLDHQGVFVLSITEDRDKTIWMATDEGLYHFSLQGLLLSHFTTSKGLSTNSFITNSIAKNDKGEIYLGSSKGVICFNPATIQKNNTAPVIRFESILVNGEFIKSSNATKSVTEYGFDENNLSFNLRSNNYIFPDQNKYIYRLLGSDTTWNTTNSHELQFDNLPSGTYSFEAKVINNDGVWSSNTLVYSFIISPPWWKSNYAYTMYVLLLITVITLIIAFMKYRFKQSQRLLIEKTRAEQQEELYNARINFFTNISHDIRTPLSLIYGPIESILRSAGLDDTNKRLLTLVQRNTRQLLKLVNELLEFKKTDTELSNRELDILSFKHLIMELSEDFKISAFQKSIDFDVLLPNDEVLVKADARLLERSIQNVLSNAFKFTPEHGRIALKLEVAHENAQLIIHDSGEGIKEELMNKIFERFYEGRNSKGSGLGLFIVKKAIEKMNGSVAVENRSGAMFTISLPLANEASVTTTVSKVDEKKGVDILPLKSNLILVVEDNDELRNYIKQVLLPYFTVITASNGVLGLEKALSAVPDLILSDVMMPEEDGLSLCANIKSNLYTSHIPVIMLTAKTGEIAEKEALKAGANDYLNKPFDPQTLVLKIRNILESQNKLHSKSEVEKQGYSYDSASSVDERFLEEFKNIISVEFTNPDFTIENLCEQMGFSRSQLYKKIKLLLGVSAVDYLQEMRLREAMHLLKTTAFTISEIAFRVGYNDQRYFSSRFKKFTGMTPGDFRNTI